MKELIFGVALLALAGGLGADTPVVLPTATHTPTIDEAGENSARKSWEYTKIYFKKYLRKIGIEKYLTEEEIPLGKSGYREAVNYSIKFPNKKKMAGSYKLFEEHSGPSIEIRLFQEGFDEGNLRVINEIAKTTWDAHEISTAPELAGGFSGLVRALDERLEKAGTGTLKLAHPENMTEHEKQDMKGWRDRDDEAVNECKNIESLYPPKGSYGASFVVMYACKDGHFYIMYGSRYPSDY